MRRPQVVREGFLGEVGTSLQSLGLCNPVFAPAPGGPLCGSLPFQHRAQRGAQTRWLRMEGREVGGRCRVQGKTCCAGQFCSKGLECGVGEGRAPDLAGAQGVRLPGCGL